MGWMLPLLLGIFWLGVRGLNANGLWYDEWFSVYQSGGAHYGPLSVSEVWQRVADDIFETPAHYILLSVWSRLVGWSEFAARALSLFLGLLAVAALYRLGREIFSPLVGLSAATLFGMSAFYISYLHEMRTYTLLTLLTVIVIWAYWRMIDRGTTLRNQAAFVLSLAALLYAHYMGLLIPAALGLYHLICVPKNRHWWRVVGLFGLALALFVIPWSGEIIHTIVYARTSETRQMLGKSSPELLADSAYLYGNASVALLIFLLVMAAGARGRRARFTQFAALGTLGVGLGVNLLLPVLNHVRYLMPAWPLTALVLGLAVQQLHWRRISPAIVLGLWIAAGVWNTSDPDYASQIRGGMFADLPWHTLVDTLKARAQPDDAVAYHRPDDVWAIERIFNYYLDDLPGRHTILELLPGRRENEEFLQQARLFIDTAPRVWLAVDKTRSPNFRLADFQAALAEHYQSCGSIFDLPHLSLDLYSRIPTADLAPDYRFGAGIGLTLVEPLPTTAHESLALMLGWQVAPDVPPYTYSAALHVNDTGGNLVAQADFGLPETGYTCLPTQVDLHNLPPGDYQLRAVVYDYTSGARLTGHTASDDQSGDRLLLGTFTLTG